MIRSEHGNLPVWAVIVAGGAGRRMGGDTPKQYLPVRGVPVLRRTVSAFQASTVVDHVVVVVPTTDVEMVRDEILAADDGPKQPNVVAGGDSRQASTAAGVAQATDSDCIIAVHDGVRPFISQDVIARAVETAAERGAALVAVPVTDTIKRVDADEVVTETIPRADLRAAQTPQVFRADVLRDALARAKNDGFIGTDEAQLVERAGYPVTIVTGEPANIKITTPVDLVRAEAIAAERDDTC